MVIVMGEPPSAHLGVGFQWCLWTTYAQQNAKHKHVNGTATTADALKAVQEKCSTIPNAMTSVIMRDASGITTIAPSYVKTDASIAWEEMELVMKNVFTQNVAWMMVIAIARKDVSFLKLEMAYAMKIVTTKHAATITVIVNVPPGVT